MKGPICFWGDQTTKATRQHAPQNGHATMLYKLFCAAMIVLSYSAPALAQVSATYNSSSTFTVPVGVTEVEVECWGGGGRGATRTSNGRGGGGGGGAYARSILPVVPGNTYTVTVGGGSTGTGAGGDSWFATSTTILAKGGSSAGNNSTSGANGGSAAASIGTVKFAGGNGANAPGSTGGGGGSSAGTAASGANGSNQNGGTAPAGGGDGGDGGNGFIAAGNNGAAPGAGGGGAERGCCFTANGGSGADGRVIVTYTPPPYVNGTCMTPNATNTIADNGCGTNNYRSIPFNLNGSGFTLGADVFVRSVDMIVSHTWGSDLRMYLRSPNGNEVALVNAPHGGTGTQYGNAAACPGGLFTFQDGGAPLSGVATNSTNVGTWAPDQSLTLFHDGSDPNGDWTIRVCDAVAQDVGAIQYTRVNLCYPPQAIITEVPDCGNNQFQVDVNITTLGSGTAGTIRYTVDNGTPVTVNGAALGNNMIGPFPNTAEVHVELTNGITNCGLVERTLFSSCPVLLDCGASLNVPYCYQNNDTRTFTFQSPIPGETVTLDFVQGGIDLNDAVNFFDGTNDQANSLGGGNYFGDLSGLSVTSTGPVIHMVVVSNGSNSCSDGGQTMPWLFEAKCTPGCAAPQAFMVSLDDCPNYQFSIEVTTYDPGDGLSVDLEYTLNNGTPVIIPNVQLFVPDTLGPFTVGDLVNIRLLHDSDPLCHNNLGTHTNQANCPSADNCINAQNLAQQTSPLAGSTIGRTSDFSFACGTATANTAPDAIHYIDVPAGVQLNIRQQSNTYDSQHYVRFGGACPGTTAIACVDDDGGEVAWVNWVNTTGNTQRVWWIQDGYQANAGNYVLEWNFTACPTTVASAATNVQSAAANANYTGFAGNYIIEYGPSATFTTPGTGATPGPNGTIATTTQTSSFQITGLAQGTEYRYFVRRDCGGSSFGDNSAGITFTTTTGTPVPNGACGQSVNIPDISCALNTGPNALISIAGQPTTLGSNVVLESVDIILSHANRGDLRITLTSPNGTVRNMILERGGAGDNLGNPNACPGSILKLRDGGTALTAMPTSNNVTGTFAPEQTLAGYSGAANGTWTMNICDNAFSLFAAGTLRYVKLNFAPLDCIGVMNGTAVPGSPCNDNNVCTINDVYSPSCNCAGTVEDTDGDGTCNANDGCPNDPNKIAPGQCGCGITDTDSDGDTVADCVDLCPTDPLKSSPGTCGCNVADTDTDGDGQADCIDSCPFVTGGVGSPCNDNNPGTILDALDANCNCVGTTCTEQVNLELNLDMSGSEISWAIAQTGTGIVVCSGGTNPAYPDNVPFPIVESCCLPVGCYDLSVFDSAGDGISGGGYQLRESGANGRRIIDNQGNFTTGSSSSGAGDMDFCVPLGDDRLIFTACDKLDWVANKYLIATENSAVSAEWVVGGTNAQQDANSGYEFWISDPNGNYSFRRFRSHRISDGYSPANATRAAHMKIHSWSHSTLTPHIPEGMLMNVRVRGRVNGVNAPFGHACRFKMDAARASCPVVWLQDNPHNTSDYSCGVTRVWGGTNSAANRVTAKPPQFTPTPSGPFRFQFRFRIPGEGVCIVRPPQSSPTLYLNWTSGTPLECSKQYEVEVRVSADGGATWCVDGNAPACDPNPVTNWGKTCMVTIANCLQSGGPGQMALDPTVGQDRPVIFPNPSNGEHVQVTWNRAGRDRAAEVRIQLFDLTGKRIQQQRILDVDGPLNTNMEIGRTLAAGVYLMEITEGRTTHIERLVVQP